MSCDQSFLAESCRAWQGRAPYFSALMFPAGLLERLLIENAPTAQRPMLPKVNGRTANRQSPKRQLGSVCIAFFDN